MQFKFSDLTFPLATTNCLFLLSFEFFVEVQVDFIAEIIISFHGLLIKNLRGNLQLLCIYTPHTKSSQVPHFT